MIAFFHFILNLFFDLIFNLIHPISQWVKTCISYSRTTFILVLIIAAVGLINIEIISTAIWLVNRKWEIITINFVILEYLLHQIYIILLMTIILIIYVIRIVVLIVILYIFILLLYFLFFSIILICIIISSYFFLLCLSSSLKWWLILIWIRRLSFIFTRILFFHLILIILNLSWLSTVDHLCKYLN